MGESMNKIASEDGTPNLNPAARKMLKEMMIECTDVAAAKAVTAVKKENGNGNKLTLGKWLQNNVWATIGITMIIVTNVWWVAVTQAENKSVNTTQTEDIKEVVNNTTEQAREQQAMKEEFIVYKEDVKHLKDDMGDVKDKINSVDDNVLKLMRKLGVE